MQSISFFGAFDRPMMRRDCKESGLFRREMSRNWNEGARPSQSMSDCRPTMSTSPSSRVNSRMLWTESSSAPRLNPARFDIFFISQVCSCFRWMDVMFPVMLLLKPRMPIGSDCVLCALIVRKRCGRRYSAKARQVKEDSCKTTTADLLRGGATLRSM